MSADDLRNVLSMHAWRESKLRELILRGEDVSQMCGHYVNLSYGFFFKETRERLPQPIPEAICEHLAPNMHWKEARTFIGEKRVKSIGLQGVLCQCSYDFCPAIHTFEPHMITLPTGTSRVYRLAPPVQYKIYVESARICICDGPIVCWFDYPARIEIYENMLAVAAKFPNVPEIMVYALQERMVELEKKLAALC